MSKWFAPTLLIEYWWVFFFSKIATWYWRIFFEKVLNTLVEFGTQLRFNGQLHGAENETTDAQINQNPNHVEYQINRSPAIRIRVARSKADQWPSIFIVLGLREGNYVFFLYHFLSWWNSLQISIRLTWSRSWYLVHKIYLVSGLAVLHHPTILCSFFLSILKKKSTLVE